MRLCCWTNPTNFICCCSLQEQRIKHLHPTKLNYVVLITVLYHVKSVFTYLFVPATWCFKLIIKMVLTSSELCCLASCCLKSSHPISIMILAGSQSPPMPGSDYTFFFSPVHNCQYVRLRRRGPINLLCVWYWQAVTLTDPDQAAPDHGVLSLWARSEAQVFVLSCRRTGCRTTKWKKKKKSDRLDFPCCGRKVSNTPDATRGKNASSEPDSECLPGTFVCRVKVGLNSC